MTDQNRSWEEVREDLLANDAELRAAYLDLEPAFLLARELLRAREELGLSQSELAARMGAQQSVISRIERMETMPTLATAAAVARGLGRRLQIRFADPAEGIDPDREREILRAVDQFAHVVFGRATASGAVWRDRSTTAPPESDLHEGLADHVRFEVGDEAAVIAEIKRNLPDREGALLDRLWRRAHQRALHGAAEAAHEGKLEVEPGDVGSQARELEDA